MRVLGIDPGFERLGVAIVEKDKTEILVYSTCIQTSKTSDFSDRLFFLGEEISRIIKEYSPDAMALEDLFFTNNQKTVMRVAEVRGMLLYLAKKHKLIIAEYTPLQIKIAITGYGRADKAQMETMLYKLVKIPTGKRLDDELDAVACGLTHLASYKSK